MKKPEFIIALLRKYPLLANRYFLAFATFLIWVVFIDASSLISQYSGNRKLFELKREKRYYQQEIRKTKVELSDLFFDEQSLEKFAREHYFMKKDSEDVWIVMDTTTSATTR
jgi:cell division protein DivIC